VRYAIYARSAVTDRNCEMQLRELRAYVERRGCELAGEYVDTGCSGTGTRPHLTRLMADAHLRQIDCVLVWTLDRWGRSLTNCLATIVELCRLHIGWIAVSQGLDMCEGHPGSQALLTLLAALRGFESEAKRESVKAGMRIAIREAKRRGEQCGRPKVFFDRERVHSLRREGKSIREIAAAMRIGYGTVSRVLSDPKG